MTSSTSQLDGRGASLLIVDDSPTNLQLLAGMLRHHGFSVRPVPSGELALQAARSKVPDLVLLDIRMPGMDGYEVCRQMKADPALKDVPVIFISGLDSTIDKVKAFSAGGVDYVTKPFQFEEVEARVRTHLALRQQARQIEESYRQLRDLEHLRDSLTHLIVHDLRAPLMGILGYLTFALENQVTQGCAPLRDDLSEALSSSRRLVDMISSILDISRLEEGKMPLTLHKERLDVIVENAMKLLRGRAEGRDLKVLPATDDLEVCCDPELILRVVCNLVDNALKHTPENAAVSVSMAGDEAGVKVSVQDKGPGIPAEFHGKLFAKFGQAEMRRTSGRHSTGLGLVFCKLAVEAHGGQVGVESEVGKGSTFWFVLPRNAAPVTGPAV